jgi:dTDP-4-amino-4,6-dideoxygalactose transaminase
MNMDPDYLETIASEDTAAIVPVHYGGVGCEMDQIGEIARDYGAVVIEDAAQALNAKYQGDWLGTIGDVGCYSFHGTKSYVAGEGGAIVIKDPRLNQRAEIIRQKGTNYEQFRRGDIDRYRWVDVGSSYIPSELQMALATAQIKRRDEIRNHQREVDGYYRDALRDLAEREVFCLPEIPEGRSPNYHLFYIRLRDAETRDALCTHLRSRGIGAASHYEPLHSSPMGRSFVRNNQTYSVTEREAGRILRLPIHLGVDGASRESVVAGVRSYFD